MKQAKLSFLAFIICLISVFTTSAQTFKWQAKQGSTSTDNTASIVADASGNTYAIGSYNGTLKFSKSSLTLTSNGGYDIFIAKYDKNGNLIWATSAGGPSDDRGASVALDGDRIFITGSYQSTSTTTGPAVFGSKSVYSAGSLDLYVAKYDTAGNYVWVKTAGGSAADFGNDIKVDAGHNVFSVGNYNSSTIKFGAHTFTNGGNTDGYLLKMDSTGTVKWASNVITGANEESAFGLTIDNANRLYVTGRYGSSSVTVAGKSGFATNGGSDFCLCKLDTAGNGLWAVGEGGSSDDRGRSVTYSKSGNDIYVTGNFSSSFKWASTTTITSNGNSDFMIVKYDSAGNFKWIETAGSTSADIGAGITSDVFDNIYVTGNYQSGASGTDFNGSGSTKKTLTSSGSDDLFLVCYRPDGTIYSAVEGGSSSSDVGSSVTQNSTGDVWIAGSFTGTASFGAGSLTSNGSTDGYTTKLNDGSAVNPPVYYSTPLTFCTGDSVILSTINNSGYSYQWYKGSSAISGATNYNYVVKATGIYNVKITLSGGSSGTSSGTSVTVNVAPSFSISAPKNPACDSIMIFTKAVAGNTYQWNLAGSPISGATNNIFYGKTSGNYTLTVSNGTCSTTSSAVAAVVSASPTASITHLGSTHICNGDSLKLHAFPQTSGNTFQWYVNSKAKASATDSTYYASKLHTNTYGVKVTTSGGCTGSATISVDIDSQLFVRTGPAKSICAGTSAVLGFNKINAYKYSWTSKPAGLISNQARPVVTPFVTTTYYLTITDTTIGCSRSDSVIYTVLQKPAPSVISNSTICSGDSISIGGAANKNESYSWTSNPSGFTSSSSNPKVAPSGTTIYLLIDSSTTTGCTAKKNVTITVNARPSAPSLGSNTPLCAGGTLKLTSTSVAGATYKWTGPDTFSRSKQNVQRINTTSADSGVYKLVVTVSGCSDSSTISATINPNPTASHIANSGVCSGSSISIGATSISGHTYSWTSNPAGYTSSSSNPSVSPSVTTTYKLTESITSTGCSKTDSVKITVSAAPSTPSPSSNSPICAGGSLNLSVKSVASATYSWTGPNSFSSSSQNPSISGITSAGAGTYSLTVTVGGCTSASGTTSVTVNALPTPTPGSTATICSGASTSIGGTATAGHTYSWTSNPSGYTSSSANPTVSPTVTTVYKVTETITSTGCANSDSVKITVNALPAAAVGSATSICSGSSTKVGATGVAGHTYSWISNPSGFTSTSNMPAVFPTVNTEYILTEKITATGCTKTDSVLITVNPLPTPGIGSGATLCSGGSTKVGTTAVSGHTYSWTSNPSGFTSTSNMPAVFPTVTTWYILKETIAASGCSNKDSVKVTVNPAPSASTGSAASICNGSSASIGASATAGHTYSWTSNPSGFTSSSSNPTVNPTVNTYFILTEKITATGCSKTDSVKITVNPLPTPGVGSGATICSGSSTKVGTTGVSGHTYSWTSNPSGFTSTSNMPAVFPTVTTWYILTEKITATGCSNKDSVKVSVNPAPSASTGSATAICNGSSASIGASSTAGHTYSWTSNPSGFTSSSSNPTVSPSVTTYFILTEKITATGCSKTDSVKITVNPLPSASVGSATAICKGSSTKVGATGVSGDTYSWTSNPSGFTSTSNMPAVFPTVTTWYILTEKVTATGCSKTDSVKITVNPLPVVSVGSGKTICKGGSASIGASSTSGHTYSWTSNPSGYTSSSSNPTVSPMLTTMYKLTETITATGCSNSDSVKITVNPVPGAKVGSATSICNGSSTVIGASSTAGHTYSWTSNPSGFTSSSSNPSVNPFVTTYFKLTETITATGCTNSDSVKITVNPLPSANVGSATAICNGSSASIGASSTAGHTYSWISNPSGYTSSSANPTVSPSVTTYFKLTETITATGCSKTDSVKITVNPLPSASVGSATAICNGSSSKVGATGVSGDTYSWTSNPSGFTSTSNMPAVFPTVTTWYILTEKVTATGCTKTDSVKITVNPLPSANVGSAATICSGSSVKVGATGVSGDTYSWTSNPSGFTSTSNMPAVFPTVTTLYRLTEKITATGCSKTDSVKVTVNPVPSATIASNSTICSGTTVSLGGSSTSGHTYSWTSNPSGYTSSSSNPSVKPASTITYYQTETITATGCKKSDSVKITVNPTPSSPTASNNGPLCTGQTLTLSASTVSGASYVWSGPNSFSSSSQNPTKSSVTLADTGVYSVYTQLGSCTSSTITTKVKINARPAPSVSGSSTVCALSSKTYSTTSNSGDTYSWTISGGSITSGSGTNSVTVTWDTVSSGSIMVKESNPSGCSDSSAMSITINPLPSATVVSNQTICSSQKVVLGGSSTSGHTYSWTSNPSGFTSSFAGPFVTPTTTTTYYLKETITATGCTKSDSTKLTIGAKASAPVVSNNGPLCTGQTLNLSAGSIFGATYSWSGPGSYSSTSQNPNISSVKLSDSGTYTVVATIGTCVSNAGTTTVKINPLPTPSVSGNASVCAKTLQSYTTASVSGGTYVWKVSGGTVASGSGTDSITVLWGSAGAGSVRVVESNASGCMDSSTKSITINGLPTATIIGVLTVCSGDVQTYGPKSSGNTYSWTETGGTVYSGGSIAKYMVTWGSSGTGTLQLVEKNSNGCMDTAKKSVTINALPTVSVGSSTSICNGSSTSIGASSVSGNTYSWTSNPSGFTSTSSSPTVNPTVTTFYKLTQTITATGCKNTDSVKISVNPLPSASTGSATAICNGSSTSIGASSVSGNTYSWTSKPSGFTSTSSNPSVSPVTTTMYYLTETVTATGCSKSDSVKVTVNPLPSASTGSATAICNGSSTKVGATGVSGDTYSWTSNPSGFTSTSNMPAVFPTVSTEYVLTETITATGCSKTDSVKITVNPLPAASTGSATAICNGSSTKVGATGVSGDTYSWTSNPSGFTSTSNMPAVFPTVSTEYILTETITATGCSKTDSVKITVNPLPAASVGSATAICNGSSTSIGAASVSGSTYSWTSNPSGFTSTGSNPSVSPSVTTIYYLTESITATGCSKSDSVKVTVNPLPSASTGSASAICNGSSTTLGAASVSGSTYSWTSKPGGFTSTSSNPSVSPTVTTMYYLTESITATGCSKSDSVQVTVNPLPSASVGTATAICNGSSTTLGAASVSGSTYSWTSNPGGFTSTSSNPSVSPSVTTMYYLTESITATGCSKSDSVKITINASPSASVAKSTAICSGDSIALGAASTSGNTYTWTSNPSGFTSSNSNPKVSPSAKTMYYLTETITATGCSKSDSVSIDVNAVPSPSIGTAASVCAGGSGIYSTAKNAGDTYTWTATGGKITSGASTDSVNVSWGVSGVGSIQVVEMNSKGCKDSISVSVVINSLPAPSISGNTSTCNASITNYQTGFDSGATYSWNIKGGAISAGAGSDSITVNWGTGSKGTLNVIETNKFGCVDSASAVIVINPLPTAKFSTGRVCQGNATQFMDSSSTHANQTWHFGDGNSSSVVSPSYTYSKPGMYTAQLIVSTSSGCSDSITHTVEVDANPNPHWSATALGNNAYSFKADDSSLNAANYQWTFGDGVVATGFNLGHTYPKDTFYQVEMSVTNSAGCSSFFDSTINVFTGISENMHNVFDLNIYPNPFVDRTTMQYSLGSAAYVRVEIYATDGRQIAMLANERQSVGLHQVQFNAADFMIPQGIYFMRLTVDNEMVTKQIIRVK